MTLILGIDPGSRITGYGVVDVRGANRRYVTSGCIRTTADAPLPVRLEEIFSGISEIITRYQPGELAIEKVFMARSADAALKLGQARGAAIVAAASHGLAVFEYEARKIKQAVVGNGGAEKRQVQHMVRQLLALPGDPQSDAADALAIALCHVHTRDSLVRVGRSKGFRRGRIRTLEQP